MIKLSIHKGTIHSRTYTMPDAWNELTPRQFTDVAYALYFIGAANERQAYICRSLLGRENAATLPVETLMQDIFPLLEWVYKEPVITDQLLPSVKAGWLRRFYGPKQLFHNLTIKEFDYAERELYLWLESTQNGKTDEHQLWRFVACLYRPGKLLYNKQQDKDGDIRVPFNENKVDYHARVLARHLHISVACAVVLWYKACRKKVTDMYSTVFDNSKEEAEENTRELPNCVRLIRSIAASGTYGNFASVENMGVHEVLHEIEISIEDYEKQKRA